MNSRDPRNRRVRETRIIKSLTMVLPNSILTICHATYYECLCEYRILLEIVVSHARHFIKQNKKISSIDHICRVRVSQFLLRQQMSGWATLVITTHYNLFPL